MNSGLFVPASLISISSSEITLGCQRQQLCESSPPFNLKKKNESEKTSVAFIIDEMHLKLQYDIMQQIYDCNSFD